MATPQLDFWPWKSGEWITRFEDLGFSKKKWVDLSNLRIKDKPIIPDTSTIPEVWTPQTWGLAPQWDLWGGVLSWLKQTWTDLESQITDFWQEQVDELPSFNIKPKEQDLFSKIADTVIPQAQAEEQEQVLDEAMIKRFIEHWKGLWKTREEIRIAYDKWIEQWIFNIKAEPTPEIIWQAVEEDKAIEVPEEISWLDIWVKVGRWISKLWGALKIEWKFDIDPRDNRTLWGSFKNELKRLANVSRFAINLPWDTIEFAWDMINLVSDPIWTAKSLKEVAWVVTEKWLNKIFSTDTWQWVLRNLWAPEENLKQIREEWFFTTEERKIMSEWLSKTLDDNFWTFEKFENTIETNPFDTFTTVFWWFWTTKNFIKWTNFWKTAKWTVLIDKINKLEQITNPINAVKLQLWLWKDITVWAIKLPFKLTAKTIRTITPEKISTSIAWIDNISANVIKQTSKSKLDEILKQSQGAVDDIKQQTPFAIAWEKATKSLNDIIKLKSKAWANKSAILKPLENKTMDTSKIKTEFNDLIKDRFNIEIVETTSKTWKKTFNLREIPWKKRRIELSELKEFSDEIVTLGDETKIWNVDALVDLLQWKLNFKKIPWKEASTVDKTIRSFLESNINSKLKTSAWKEFTDANAKFRELLELQSDLEKLLWPKQTRVESLMKTVFSPQTGERTKKVFRKVQEITWEDLINESVLAKFAMQAVWDERAFNLLQALDLWPWFTNIKWSVIQKALQSVFAPEKIAKKLAK